MSKLTEFIKTFRIENATEILKNTSKRSDNDRVIISGPGWEYSYHYIRGFEIDPKHIKKINGEYKNSFVLGSIHVLTIDFSKVSSMGKKGVVNYVRNIFIGNADCTDVFCLEKTVDEIADYINEHLDNAFNLLLDDQLVSVKNKKMNFVVETYQGSSDEVTIMISDKYRLYEDFVDDVTGVGTANAYDIRVATLMFGVLNFLNKDSVVVFGDWYKNVHIPNYVMPNCTEYLTVIALGQIGGIIDETDFADVSFDERSLTIYELPDKEDENKENEEDSEDDKAHFNSLEEISKFIDSLFGEKPKDQKLIERVIDAIKIYVDHDYEEYTIQYGSNYDDADESDEDDDETQEERPSTEDIIESILTPNYYAVGSISTGRCFILESPSYTNVDIKYPDNYLVFPTADYSAAETAVANFEKIIHNIKELYQNSDDEDAENDDPEQPA